MAKCNNCGAIVGCSCQFRNASDGKQCCPNCIQAYEQKLAAAKARGKMVINAQGILTTQRTQGK